MPQVSKRILSKEIEAKIAETLLEAVSQLRTKSEVADFLQDLLSPVEKIMISKRLAIAVLLLKGWEYPAIKDFLKVSNATVAKISIILKDNVGYKIAVDKVAKTEAGREFWKDVVKMIHRVGTIKDTFIDDEVLNKKFKFKRKTLL